MHRHTIGLRHELRAAKTLDRQVAALENRYRGASCIVVTCGPSLANMPAKALATGLDGTLTIAVKQATSLVGQQADFHCFNSFNVSRWPVVSPETVRCFVREPTGRVPQLNPYDLRFETEDGKGDLHRSLAYRQDYSDHLLADTLLRPFGPGIMYELVVFLAVHLGVSEIITIGWDIGDSSGKNTHYYDRRADRLYFEKGRSTGAQPPPAHDRVPESLKRVRRRLLAERAHRRGDLYSRTAALVGESEVMAASTAGLAGWLRSRGIGLTIVSDSSHFAAGVERMSVPELMERLPHLPA